MEVTQTKSQKMKRFWKETLRVMRITKRPNREEFTTTVKVTGLGISVIGIVGFLIFLIKQLFF